MVEICRGQVGCVVGSGAGGGGLVLQEEQLRRAFEFSRGFTALAAGQAKVGVSTMAAKVAA